MRSKATPPRLAFASCEPSFGGAMPDLVVPQRPEAEVAGEDEQLREGVLDLMGRLD